MIGLVLDNWVVAVLCLFEYFLVSRSKLSIWLLGKHSTTDLNPQSLIPLFFWQALYLLNCFPSPFPSSLIQRYGWKVGSKATETKEYTPPQLILARNNELLGGKLITNQPALLFIVDCVTYLSLGQSAGFL